MKNYILICLLVMCCVTCDSPDASDCLQTAGQSISQEREVAFFKSIIVERGVRLIVKQDNDQKVVVRTGSNLINEVRASVENEVLIIENDNTCNLVRDYDVAVVEVSTPDLVEIRNSSELEVSSDGVLSFTSLRLVSEDYQSNYNNIGDFRLQLDVDQLRILTNNFSNYHLEGTAGSADFFWATGDGQLFARNLLIQDATIYHRGTNNWQINVTNSISGTILGYGDVILETQPASVNINETWQGRWRVRE